MANIITTSRLTITLCPPPDSSFWRVYVAIRADPSWQQEIWHGVWPPEDPVEAYEKNHALVKRRGYGLWAVAKRHDQNAPNSKIEWLGWIGYRNLDDVAPQSHKWPPLPGTMEVYVGFAREHWGKGYGPESLRAVVDDAFRTRGIEKLTACILAENEASTKCFQRVGFAPIEEDLNYEDEGIYFVLDKERWTSSAAVS